MIPQHNKANSVRLPLNVYENKTKKDYLCPSTEKWTSGAVGYLCLPALTFSLGGCDLTSPIHKDRSIEHNQQQEIMCGNPKGKMLNFLLIKPMTCHLANL